MWRGPYAVVTVNDDCLAEIQISRESKSKVVHMDKSAHPREPVDMSWIKTLPKRREAMIGEDSLEDIRRIFEEYNNKTAVHKSEVSNKAQP